MMFMKMFGALLVLVLLMIFIAMFFRFFKFCYYTFKLKSIALSKENGKFKQDLESMNKSIGLSLYFSLVLNEEIKNLDSAKNILDSKEYIWMNNTLRFFIIAFAVSILIIRILPLMKVD